MGDFTLGCLLGQYDRAQSFDVASRAIAADGDVGSWNLFFGQSSFQFVSGGGANFTVVHSSPQALRISADSSGGSETRLIEYTHSQADDLFDRWFPDVSTHGWRVDAWGRPTTWTADGQFTLKLIRAGIGMASQAFPVMNTGRPGLVRLQTSNLTSDSNIATRFDRSSLPGSQSSIDLDDVLTQVDPVVLHPDFAMEEMARQIASEHRTLSGDMHTYVWARYCAYSVPLRYLPDSHADLLNWWWERRFNLALTLDTSDSESTYIVRIVNDRQPIGRRVRPYDNLWEGTLKLESINAGALAF